MRLLVTGSSGFIGSELVRQLIGQGHEVIGTYYRGSPPRCSAFYRWDLRQSHPEGILSGVEAVIHAAHDAVSAEADVSLGLGRFLDVVQDAGIRQIFLSSLSAREDSLSGYGRLKYQLEKRAGCSRGFVVVRPGLVVGPGGLFGRLRLTLQRWPVFPLIDHGGSSVSFVGLDELVIVVKQLIDQPDLAGEFNLFSSARIPFGNMLKQIARLNHWKRLFVNIPSGPILVGLRMAEVVGLKLPIRRENVTGLRQNSDHPYVSSLASLGLVERTFAETYLNNFQT